MRRIAHLLLIASALVGMEVDIVSNPFTPHLIFSQIYTALGLPPAGLAAEEATRPDDAPAPDPNLQWVAQARLNVSVDETVAIRSRATTSDNTPWQMPGLSSPLPPAQAGWDSRTSPSPTTHMRGLPQLCRFLC